MTGKIAASDLAKIRSDDLRTAVLGNDATTSVVVLEVDLPLPRMIVSDDGSGFDRPRIRFAPGQDLAASSDAELDRIEREISATIGRSPLRSLTSSRSFVVEASGEEIGRLAGLTSVLAVWPNTRR